MDQAYSLVLLQAFPFSGAESVGGKWHTGTFVKTEISAQRCEGSPACAPAQTSHGPWMLHSRRVRLATCSLIPRTQLVIIFGGVFVTG